MSVSLIHTLVVLLILSAIPLAVAHVKRVSEKVRGIWLSLAGGIGVAYVFVDLLPELAQYQKVLEVGGILSFEEKAPAIALLGILFFSGVEHWVSHTRKEPLPDSEIHGETALPLPAYRIHILVFSFYSALIGYLVMERFHDGPGANLFLIAMMMHLLASDTGLRRLHPRTYRRSSRWFLAGFTMAGVLLGTVQALSDWNVALLSSFLAGGIILNTLKDEVPGLEQRRYWVFALSAVLYALILLAS